MSQGRALREERGYKIRSQTQTGETAIPAQRAECCVARLKVGFAVGFEFEDPSTSGLLPLGQTPPYAELGTCRAPASSAGPARRLPVNDLQAE